MKPFCASARREEEDHRLSLPPLIDRFPNPIIDIVIRRIDVIRLPPIGMKTIGSWVCRARVKIKQKFCIQCSVKRLWCLSILSRAEENCWGVHCVSPGLNILNAMLSPIVAAVIPPFASSISMIFSSMVSDAIM